MLTVENGVLELAIIPAEHQPNWLVPKSLILTVLPYDERIWTYLWQSDSNHAQEVAVYHLLNKTTSPDKLVILEGNTNVHRLALQTTGEIGYIKARISDVKDIELPNNVKAEMYEYTTGLRGDDVDKLDFMHQAVAINEHMYIVPDLDLISHRLVDLDS